MKKKIIFGLAMIGASVAVLGGCGGSAGSVTESTTKSTTTSVEVENVLLNKLYSFNSLSEREIDADFLVFYSDNTFQGIKVLDAKKHTYSNIFGTYENTDSSFTLKYGSESLTGVIESTDKYKGLYLDIGKQKYEWIHSGGDVGNEFKSNLKEQVNFITD